MSTIPTKARGTVAERQQRQCARCGMHGTEIHHRQRRREGGHAVGNLVLLCGTCHRWAHANPTVAQELGYIVSVSVDDPTTIPIRTFVGWVRYDNDGGVNFATDIKGDGPHGTWHEPRHTGPATH